jgi:hypothetical protein
VYFCEYSFIRLEKTLAITDSPFTIFIHYKKGLMYIECSVSNIVVAIMMTMYSESELNENLG